MFVMINILLNRPNFNEIWAYPSLQQVLLPTMHVLIMPLDKSAGWANDGINYQKRYQKGSRIYEQLIQPFSVYQIPSENIVWFNPYQDSEYELQQKIQQSDVIYLVGSNEESMMQCSNDFHLKEHLNSYEGIVMGDYHGSLIMLDEYYSSNGWDDELHQGLGLLQGFQLDSSYVEDVTHLKRMIDVIEIVGKAMFCFAKKGGVIIDCGHYELLGDAFICYNDDLDCLYQAYTDAKSRFDYYGDNGNW